MCCLRGARLGFDLGVRSRHCCASRPNVVKLICQYKYNAFQLCGLARVPHRCSYSEAACRVARPRCGATGGNAARAHRSATGTLAAFGCQSQCLTATSTSP